MTISVRQIHPVFVGEVSGVDIARPLAPDEVAAIEAGMDRYAVLVFHDQKITDEQQMAFSRKFGALEDARGGNITKPEDKHRADMRAAYDTLDAATKTQIEDPICEHSLMYSRGSLGMLDYSDEERAMFRPVRQSLVRTHPVTGRKSLYLSSSRHSNDGRDSARRSNTRRERPGLMARTSDC